MRSRFVMVALASAVVTALVIGGPSLARRGHGSQSNSSKPKFAALSGKNEVSATTGKKGAGDSNGRGSFTLLRVGSDTLCYGLTVTGIAQPNAAHIHKAKRGKNGGIVVTLGTPDGGSPGSSSGCLEGFSSSLTSEIASHPERFYVNVHNADFPGGAVRGQLFSSKGRG